MERPEKVAMPEATVTMLRMTAVTVAAVPSET
jgi:hypothetical protein